MSAIRVATAGSGQSTQRSVSPTPRAELERSRTVQPAAIVAVRAHLMAGWESVKGGHEVQETANLDAVPIPELQRVREVYQRGLDSTRGGHSVQRATYEAQVSADVLVSNRETIAENLMGFADGSPIQQATRPLEPFDPAASARQLASDVSHTLSWASSDLPRLQAAQLHGRAARQILG